MFEARNKKIWLHNDVNWLTLSEGDNYRLAFKTPSNGSTQYSILIRDVAREI